ncbi:hypothetical protein D1007_20601 [Hordeum vulgare]|nr:hypothetical protein D1007_20601 [Hordeum vulgare]
MSSFAGDALRLLPRLPRLLATGAAPRSPAVGPGTLLGVVRELGEPLRGRGLSPISRGRDLPLRLPLSRGMPPWPSTSAAVDSLAADVHAAAEAVVISPLEFDTAQLLNDPSEALQLDTFSPTLSAAASDMGQNNITTSTTACTMELQLGAVTGRVSKMQLGAATDRPEARGLFRASKQALISAAPVPATARRQVAPPKSRASSTPTRHSARQAASGSTVPVGQRASLRLVKELGLLGPRDKMADEVVRALLQHFEEPLSDGDLAVIAKLTRLDSEALCVMAGMIGPEGFAEEAMV